MQTVFSFPRRCVLTLAAGAFFFLLQSVSARTDLTGTIGGKTLTADGNPYFINGHITVSPGERLVIGEGCRLFFNSLTGLTVDGNLIVSGTRRQPVLFTSINDSLSPAKKKRTPDSFDWQGITISEKADTVSLSHFTLSYSVQGIDSRKDSICIDSGVFINNGQQDLTINNIVKDVKRGVPFSYYRLAVSYDPNGATGGGVPGDAKRYNKGDTATVAANTGLLVKSGFLFDDWNSAQDGRGARFEPGSGLIMSTCDVKLFAQWQPDSSNAVLSAATAESQKNSFYEKMFLNARPAIRYGLLAIGIIATGVAVYQNERTVHYSKKLTAIHDSPSDYLAENDKARKDGYKSYYDKTEQIRNNRRTGMIIGYCLGGTGLAGFAVSFRLFPSGKQ